MVTLGVPIAAGTDAGVSLTRFDSLPGELGLETEKVAVATGNGDRRPGGQDTRAGNDLCCDGITQAEGHAAAPAEIAHRGDSRAERLAGGRDSAQQELLVIFDQHIAQWKDGATEDQVHMAVNQPRDDRQVDNLGVGRRLTRCLDGDDLAVFDVQRPIPLDGGTGPVNQATRADNLHPPRLACPCPK